ncbi:Myblike DNAbinding domain-containing protein [Entophlyctis sp. JEL0112]|nr:Myblike DNAbinding domain-containing protein [Entophlyctis sp. JEL0112]
MASGSSTIGAAIEANLHLQECAYGELLTIRRALLLANHLEETTASITCLGPGEFHSAPDRKLSMKPPFFVDQELNTPPPNIDAGRPHFKHVGYLWKAQFWHTESLRELREEIEREKMRIALQPSSESSSSQSPPPSDESKWDWERISAGIISGKTAADCRIEWTQNSNPRVNRNEFSDEEVGRLAEIGERFGWNDWDAIADQMGVGMDELHGNAIRPWTTEEDNKMLSLVEEYGEGNWATVSMHMGDRSRRQCQIRWRQNLKPGLNRGRFTAEEDERLLAAIEMFQLGNWAEIARAVKTRSDVQCRERYLNFLDPNLAKGSFSEEERQLLLSLVDKHGEKWSVIAREFKTRSAKACRRQYKTIQKKRLKEPKRVRLVRPKSGAGDDNESDSGV